MLVQIKNRVLLLEAVSYAAITFPDENSDNDWIELQLIIDGVDLILTGDEALSVWHAVQRNSVNISPAPAIEQDVITAPYGLQTL